MISYQLKKIHQEHLARKGILYTDSDGTQFIGTQEGRLQVYSTAKNDILGINKILDSLQSQINIINSIPKVVPYGNSTEVQYNLNSEFHSDQGFTRNPVTQMNTLSSDDGIGDLSTLVQSPAFFNLSNTSAAYNTVFTQTDSQVNFVVIDLGTLSTTSYLQDPSSFQLTYNDGVTTAAANFTSVSANFNYSGTVNTAGIQVDNTNFQITNFGYTWTYPTTDGLLNAPIITNGIGTLSFGQPISSGVYNPHVNGIFNVTGITGYNCQYLQIGNVVTISGKADVDITIAGNSTEFTIETPIFINNFVNDYEAGGTGASSAGQTLTISANVGSTDLVCDLKAISAGNQSFFFSCTYQIIP